MKKYILLLSCLLEITIISSCAWQTTKIIAPVSLPDKFSETGEKNFDNRWWQAFEEPLLNKLVEKALNENFSIKVAFDRIKKAEAIAKKERAAGYPNLSGDAKYFHDFDISESLSLSAGFEIDIWGRLNAAKDAAEFDSIATKEDYYASEIILAAEVAKSFYAFVKEKGIIEISEKEVSNAEKILTIFYGQFSIGNTSAVNILEQRKHIESIKNRIIKANADKKIAEHRMAALLGSPSYINEISKRNSELPEIPPLPNTGIPAALIDRRPDVRSKYFKVVANDRRVASAISSRFPNISLFASKTTTKTPVYNLFEHWTTSIGADILASLFDAGYKKAEVEEKKTILSESINNYGETILNALKDTEEALTRDKEKCLLLANIKSQLELAKSVAEQKFDNYKKGIGNFTDFLFSVDTVANLEISYLTEHLNAIEARIDLYKALGGSWKNKE